MTQYAVVKEKQERMHRASSIISYTVNVRYVSCAKHLPCNPYLVPGTLQPLLAIPGTRYQLQGARYLVPGYYSCLYVGVNRIPVNIPYSYFQYEINMWKCPCRVIYGWYDRRSDWKSFFDMLRRVKSKRSKSRSYLILTWYSYIAISYLWSVGPILPSCVGIPTCGLVPGTSYLHGETGDLC